MFRSKQALILSTPGGAVGTMMTLFCGYYSDRKNERMIPIIFAVVPTIIGSGKYTFVNRPRRCIRLIHRSVDWLQRNQPEGRAPLR